MSNSKPLRAVFILATLLSIIAFVGLPRLANAQSLIGSRTSESQVALNALGCIRQFMEIGAVERLPYDVEGDYFLFTSVVIADRLNLLGNASLVFSRDTVLQSKAARQCEPAVYVVSSEMNLQGGLATVTWDRAPNERIPLDRGQAPAGASAVAPGESGSDGSAGAPGNSGFAGRSAPTIYLVLTTVTGDKLTLDFQGEVGGVGGVGQTGGNGGSGRQGRSASKTPFGCKRGPGAGGNGGNGGDGGPGGVGGDGGDGATVVVITTNGNEAHVRNSLSVNIAGGQGGPGGPGGEPGRGGKGASEGVAQRPYCRPAGQDGQMGEDGLVGDSGSSGQNGLDGDYFLLALPDEEFEGLLGRYRDEY